MKKNIIFLFLMLVWLTQPIHIIAQTKQSKKVTSSVVTAQVVDSKDNPISGVLVSGNEGAVDTKTNELGSFTITIKDGSSLILEAEGYEKYVTNAVRIITNFKKIVLQPSKNLMIDANVRLPFQTMTKQRTTGNISVVDANESLKTDSRMEVSAHLNSKVTGNFGGFNFHGLGNAVTIVDGIKREVNDINMQEVEQITVLKDAYSRMLYGADGDANVILITTKSGAKFKKVMNFNVEQGVNTAIMKPKFLDAARYMETYNKANKNDGGLTNVYRQGVIDSTRQNLDPVLFPNNDYWSSDYVNNTTNYTNVYAEASGGNDKVQYFLNLGWKRNKGWLAMPENDETNKLNLRGKIDFEVTDWLKMKADIVAIFDLYKGPESRTFYSDASKLLPHLYPLLIPIDRVRNDSALAGKKPFGNSLLGGTSVYTQNLYGDMNRGGSRSDLNRFLQYMVGFDINLDKLTKGLKVSGVADMDFFNYYSQFIDNNYAIYQIDSINAMGTFNLKKVGEDRFTNRQSVSDANSSFRRTWNGYVTANYDRTFGKHQISAVALGYYSQLAINDVDQDAKRLRFGGQANYTYDNKYILEAGLVSEGSNKLNLEDRFKTTPSVGAAWVLSNENFMKSNKIFDYLKLRATYGVISNDNWTLGNYNGYFLYESSFARTSNFTYNNALNSNASVTIRSLGSVYDMQTRKEFVGGVDAYLFNKKLWFESSYWNSLSDGNLVTLSKSSPSTLGLPIIGNFNSTRYQGLEMGVTYREQLGDLKLNVGLNYLYSVSKIEKFEEPVYPENSKYLSRVGTSASAMWGLTSLGLFSADDFEADGSTLKAGLPIPSWGVVRAGDIKYKDINGDNIINSDDQTVLGLNSNNQQLAFNVELSYKNWQFFALGSSSWGGYGQKNNNYYWFRGKEAKYSEEALKSYDPENPNPNAEYPRLTLTNGNNNYQGSSFWSFDRASFWLNTVQLAYNFNMSPASVLSDLKLYARGGNLLTVGKSNQITQLNWNSAPQSRVFTLGLVANF